MKFRRTKCQTSGTRDTQPCAVFVAVRSFALANSRLPLMNKLRALGWRVVAAGNRDEHVGRLTSAGIEFEEVPFDRSGLAPRRDFAAFLRLARLYRRLNPTLIHHCQSKPVILGCAAARLCPKAKVVNSITGLGHAFIAGGVLRRLASTGYRLMLGRAERTIFENPDDLQLFLDEGLVRRSACRLLVFSGIDVERFVPPSAPQAESSRVVMVSRLLWEKGVGEFVEAAARSKQELPGVRFQLAGEFDSEHPSRVPSRQVDQWVADGLIEYLGYVRDMPALYAQSALVVLPSYREGVPRTLLEAGASGVPVVTCDTPGCREAVEDGVTGLLVPPKDSRALADAIVKLMSDVVLRRRMGQVGRQYVKKNYDIRIIADKHLELYEQIGVQLHFQDEKASPSALVA